MERAYGLDVPWTLEETLSPERTALIVYDMQVGTLGQLPHARDVTGKVQRVLTSARKAGMRVFFMRHLSLSKEVAGVFGLSDGDATWVSLPVTRPCRGRWRPPGCREPGAFF